MVLPTCFHEETVGCNSGRLKSSMPDLAGLLDHQSELDGKILLQISHIIVNYFASRNAAHVFPARVGPLPSFYTCLLACVSKRYSSDNPEIGATMHLVYKVWPSALQTVMGVEKDISPARGFPMSVRTSSGLLARTHMSLTRATSGSISSPSIAPASSM